MASLKEVRNRISSVSSTQQITKAMKMVAAAKLRKAQDGIMQLRPYASKLAEVIANVSSSDAEPGQYAIDKGDDKILYIVVSSDRGLCGAFNSYMFKAVVASINKNYKSQFDAGNVSILTIGKKAKDYFKRRDYNVIEDYTEVLTNLSFDVIKNIAEDAMGKFESGEFSKVYVGYNEFKNVATQIQRVDQYLPIPPAEVAEGEESGAVDYIFEPNKEEIVEDLIPKSLKVTLYKAVLESNASEQGARMTAMDKATENAGELLKELKLTYNRSRQAAITTEILEIVGGAEALDS